MVKKYSHGPTKKTYFLDLPMRVNRQRSSGPAQQSGEVGEDGGVGDGDPRLLALTGLTRDSGPRHQEWLVHHRYSVGRSCWGEWVTASRRSASVVHASTADPSRTPQ